MTYGRTISTKIWLNTRVKPIDTGYGPLVYPYYVRVRCRNQLSIFKYIGPKWHVANSYSAKHEFPDSYSEYLENNLSDHINFILNLVSIFDKKNFSIQRLPLILKAFYELQEDLNQNIINNRIKELMGDSPLGDMIAIIDWSENPDWIVDHLNFVNKKLKLNAFAIPYDRIPFKNVENLLLILKEGRTLQGDIDKHVSAVFTGIDINKKDDIANYTRSIIKKGIQFYRFAHKLTTITKA